MGSTVSEQLSEILGNDRNFWVGTFLKEVSPELANKSLNGVELMIILETVHGLLFKNSLPSPSEHKGSLILRSLYPVILAHFFSPIGAITIQASYQAGMVWYEALMRQICGVK